MHPQKSLSQTPLTCVIDKQIKNRKKCHLMCFGGPELCCLAVLCCWSQKLEAEGTFYDLLSLAQGIIKMDFLLQLSKAIQAILIQSDTQSSKRTEKKRNNFFWRHWTKKIKLSFSRTKVIKTSTFTQGRVTGRFTVNKSIRHVFWCVLLYLVFCNINIRCEPSSAGGLPFHRLLVQFCNIYADCSEEQVIVDARFDLIFCNQTVHQ